MIRKQERGKVEGGNMNGGVVPVECLCLVFGRFRVLELGILSDVSGSFLTFMSQEPVYQEQRNFFV